MVVAALCIFLGLAGRLYGINLAYTSDEGYWLQRTVRFGDAILSGDYVSTYRSGHPGVTVMWTGFLGMGPATVRAYAGGPSTNAPSLERAPGAEQLMSSARIAVALLTTALLAAVAVLAGRLLGPAGLLGGVLLAADPYLLGMSRLLHVDAFLSPLLLVAVLAASIYWLQGRQWPYLALSAVAGGLALLTKAPAIALLPYFGALWLVAAQPWKSGWRAWGPALFWGVGLTAVYIALWPALWVRPLEGLIAVARFSATLGGAPHLWPTYFLGAPTTGDPGLLFYPISIALRLGPAASIGLVLLAGVAAARRLAGGSRVLWLLGFVLIFVDIMAIGSKKFDRYMLPAICVLTLLGGVGIWGAARLLAPRLAALVVALAILGQVGWLISTEPYPLAAYNPLLGGTAVARQTIMVGWGEGLEQTAAYLNSLPNAKRLIASTQYHHVLRLPFNGQTVRVPSGVTVDYYVVYVNMVQRNTVPIPVSQAMATTEPVFTATVNGVPFAWVYKGPFMISSQADIPTGGDEDSEGEGSGE
ncbi:MAG: glycosyltransferase family 39 protein [Chloroflexota bacterium]